MGGDLLAGDIPPHWEFTTLGQVCRRGGGSIQTGPFGSQLHASDYVPVGIPSIMPTNIGDNRIVEDGIVRVTEADAARLSQHRVQVGDIVYSRRGDVEKRALIRRRETGWLCGTGCLKVRLGHGSVDPVYASYFLGHPAIREWIVRHAIGATMPNLNTAIMSAVPFALPPLAEQHAIARILGTLDDKIELNRKMNATLEAMARALFKSWFVDFDPVRAKAEGRAPIGMDAETAKLFPSDFVDSELGPIPKGWTAGRVGDVIEIHDSRRVPLSSREREQRRGPFPYYGATSVMDHVDAFLFDGRFVLVGEDGSVVTPEGLPFTQYVWGRFWVNNHAHVLSGIRGVSQEHLYLMFQQTNIAAFVTGAVQAKLSQGNMRKIPLVVAPDAVNAKFGAIIDPLFARFRALSEESRTLARLRDDLLPRLLSGELSVTGAERAVEEVA